MKNTPKELLSYKDWAEAGNELELIGQRLDIARKFLAKSKEGTWAGDYWKQVYDRLLRKWRQTIMLMDIGLKQIKPIEEDGIDRNWFEKASELSTGFELQVPEWAESYKISYGLNYSWEKGIEEKIQKARQGLA
jgi:hypothetical protein